MNLVIVSLCTNDYRNGLDTEHVKAVDIGGAIDIHWTGAGLGPTCRVVSSFLTIGRKKFPVRSFKEWYGNWCWNAVGMSPKAASDLLNHLSKDDRWVCEGGICDLTDAFDQGKVSAEILAEALA